MKRDEVLDKAKEIIGGPRAEEYGDSFENFTLRVDIRFTIFWDSSSTECQAWYTSYPKRL
jgi:hypothetical protein